jgi:hypothetical protein
MHLLKTIMIGHGTNNIISSINEDNSASQGLVHSAATLVVARFSLSTSKFNKVPFFYDGGRTCLYLTYSLETVGEFDATNGEEGVGRVAAYKQ